jgi:hypothetical protein
VNEVGFGEATKAVTSKQAGVYCTCIVRYLSNVSGGASGINTSGSNSAVRSMLSTMGILSPFTFPPAAIHVMASPIRRGRDRNPPDWTAAN